MDDQQKKSLKQLGIAVAVTAILGIFVFGDGAWWAHILVFLFVFGAIVVADQKSESQKLQDEANKKILEKDQH